MVVSVLGRCPLCGEKHHIPDVRSMDPKEMGCIRSSFDIFGPGDDRPYPGPVFSIPEPRMVCTKCGFDAHTMDEFCPDCGNTLVPASKSTAVGDGTDETLLQKLLRDDFECVKCGTSFGNTGGGLFQFASHYCPTGKEMECRESLRKLNPAEQIQKALDQWQLETFGPTRRSGLFDKV